MQSPYRKLLNTDLTAEAFARKALTLLEAKLREIALLSLQEWLKTGIASQNLFTVIANLQFPSWGTWNGLITSLRKAHNKALQSSDADKIKQVPALSKLLNHLHRNIKTPDNKVWIKSLYKHSKQSMPRKPTLQSLLAAPISVRNHIAHLSTNQQYWQDTANTLRPLLQWLDEQNDQDFYNQFKYATPWFIEHKGQHLPYGGISSKGDYINYVSRDETDLIKDSKQVHKVLLAFQQIMGKIDLQEQDFRKLLSKLAPEESKGVLMGDYLVGKFVGEGSHGTVHKGFQLSTGRQVAIKFLKDDMTDDVKHRFKQEAEFLSRLNHQHIVNVIDYGKNEAWQAPKAYSLADENWYKNFSNGNNGGTKTYIAMEWISGQTLDGYYHEQKDQPVDFPKLTQWFIDIAAALEHVHQSDIIHRDIKPSNLMITEQGSIKLMDFGIARSHEGLDGRLTTDLNARLGSPAYMSPEQIKASDAESLVGPASDVYGLTAVFYELYTKKRLFDHGNETVESITDIKKQGKQRPEAPKSCNKKMPWELNIILNGGLENEVGDRYKSVERLRQDLQRYQNQQPIAYKRPSIWRRLGLWYKRNWRVANLTAVFFVILASSTLWYLDSIKEERDATKQQILETNYSLAKAFEEKAMRALEKADEIKKLNEYQMSWLYGLEAMKKETSKENITLKQSSLNKLTDLLTEKIIKIDSLERNLDVGSHISSNII